MPLGCIVAIDGPAGAGKSAAARELAKALGVPYLDTGAMYRAVAWAALERGVTFPLDGDGERLVVSLAETLPLALVPGEGGTRILSGGRDVTPLLRRPAVSRAASQISAVPGVRRALVARQRQLVPREGAVVEGRDIGTVVFPEAPVKVFLTARPEVRARRRLEELRRQGVEARWEEVAAEQRERDARDAGREDSPLRPAPGAIILDTSDLTLQEVVERLLDAVRRWRRSLDRAAPVLL